MILIPYRSVIELARDLESRDGRYSDPAKRGAAAAPTSRRPLAALRSVVRRRPWEAVAGATARSRANG
jgi:hypothetical protein